MESLHTLLSQARAELAMAKVTLANLGQRLDQQGASKDADAWYSALNQAVLRLDGTLSLDSQALLAGSDPVSRIQSIQPVYDMLVAAHQQAQMK